MRQRLALICCRQTVVKHFSELFLAPLSLSFLTRMFVSESSRERYLRRFLFQFMDHFFLYSGEGRVGTVISSFPARKQSRKWSWTEQVLEPSTKCVNKSKAEARDWRLRSSPIIVYIYFFVHLLAIWSAVSKIIAVDRVTRMKFLFSEKCIVIYNKNWFVDSK